MRNLGTEPVFSDFRVDNPASGGSYRVAILADAYPKGANDKALGQGVRALAEAR